MISIAQSLSIGDAVRVILAPAAGALVTRVLRKVTDDIASETDPGAGVVFEGAEGYFVDTSSLTNGVTYYYRAFDFDGSVWTGSPSVSATPSATAVALGADPLALVRMRLAAGLKVEVGAGRLQHVTGAIPVLTAPPTYEQTRLPIVTVHLQNDSPSGRALGELEAVDSLDPETGLWTSSEGFLSDVTLLISAWSLNPDERIAIRQAIKKVLVGNLAVFDDAGMVLVSFTSSDSEDMESYNTPLYMTVFNFTCMSPFVVSDDKAKIQSITITGDVNINGVVDHGAII